MRHRMRGHVYPVYNEQVFSFACVFVSFGTNRRVVRVRMGPVVLRRFRLYLFFRGTHGRRGQWGILRKEKTRLHDVATRIVQRRRVCQCVTILSSSRQRFHVNLLVRLAYHLHRERRRRNFSCENSSNITQRSLTDVSRLGCSI